MLFKYKRTNHIIDKYHVWVKHLVLDVWCRASTPFTTNLLHPEFAAVVNAMPRTYLLNSIEIIHNKLINKPKSFKKLIGDAFRKNNSIESLCSGRINPIQYSDIKVLDKELTNDIYGFCVKLYDRLSKEDPRIKASFKGINHHYNSFFSRGKNISVCPFCGLVRLLNSYDLNREAYDHFFPKELYPFNSVNFDNLAPMCHTCNSKSKSRKDPINLRFGGPRKTVFFPFSSNQTNIDINFQFSKSDVENLTPTDIDVVITSNNSQNEVQQWREIFKIDSRYKAICCDESAYNGWLEEYLLLSKISDITLDKYIETKEISPFNNQRFIEVAYLRACSDVKAL